MRIEGLERGHLLQLWELREAWQRQHTHGHIHTRTHTHRAIGIFQTHLEVLFLQNLLPPVHQESSTHVQVEVGEALGLGLTATYKTEQDNHQNMSSEQEWINERSSSPLRNNWAKVR